LLSSSYVFDNTSEFLSSINSFEMSSSNYARQNLEGVSVLLHQSFIISGSIFDADDITFMGLEGNAGSPGWAVIYANGANDASRRLICALPLSGTEEDRLPDGNLYIVNLPHGGIGSWDNSSSRPYWYISGALGVMNGTVDVINDDLMAILTTSAYSFLDTHKDPSFITNEISGNFYSRIALSNVSVLIHSGNTGIYIDCDDLSFPAFSLAAGQPASVIIYDDSHPEDLLLWYLKIDSPLEPNGNKYYINISETGIAEIHNT
jgi:hypothetical protein